MGSDESTVPDTVARLARYDKSSGNRHDDDNHDGGQDSGRRANASGTLGEIVQAHAGTIDRRRLWNVTVNRRSFPDNSGHHYRTMRAATSPLRPRGSGRNDADYHRRTTPDLLPGNGGTGRGPTGTRTERSAMTTAPPSVKQPHHYLLRTPSPSTKRR